MCIKQGLKNEKCKLKNANWERATGGPHRPPLRVGARPLPDGEGERHEARLIFLNEGGVSVTLFENASSRGGWFGQREVSAFLTACDLFLGKNRADVVVTYGGDPVSVAVQRLAKRHGAKVVFLLHNFAYHDRAAFALVDYIIVPSDFSRRYYRDEIGLECNVLSNVVHWEEAEQRSEVGGRGSVAASQTDLLLAPGRPLPAKHVTFINPHESKGVYVFARIVHELAARRPDIPILVTQGRSRGDALRNPELGFAPRLLGEFPIAPTSDGRNITTMPFTPDPREFYAAVFSRTKLLLMPSLWLESFGLVAAEAMLNGIPVLASNRGALTGDDWQRWLPL